MKRSVYASVAIFTFIYLMVGAVVFHFLEGNNETDASKTYAKQHEDFLEEHECITRAVLDEYVQKVLAAHGEGVQVATITTSNSTGNMTTIEEEIENVPTNWDIASSILFCITVISTIGYGNLSPKTWGGQLFCIFYALGGVPIFATVMVGTGERLQIPIKKLQAGVAWVKNNPTKDAKIKSFVVLSTGTLLLVFVPSIVFLVTQGWTFLESVYYTIVTLTTIGFGDLIPDAADYISSDSDSTKKVYYLYRIILGLWIWIGLSWVALVLSEIGTFMQSQITTAASNTQERLSNLEGMVKKKAKETKDRIISKKDKNRNRSDSEDRRESTDVEIYTGENALEEKPDKSLELSELSDGGIYTGDDVIFNKNEVRS